MYFNNDVWYYIFTFLEKPYKKYDYMRELKLIIKHDDLFFQIDECNYYDEYGNYNTDDTAPKTFYERYKHSVINKKNLNYNTEMHDFINLYDYEKV